jgi:hypothetical protein
MCTLKHTLQCILEWTFQPIRYSLNLLISLMIIIIYDKGFIVKINCILINVNFNRQTGQITLGQVNIEDGHICYVLLCYINVTYRASRQNASESIIESRQNG